MRSEDIESEKIPTIMPDIAAALYYQRYDRDREIHDVVRVPLRKHRGENGWFCELLRLESGLMAGAAEGFDVRQVSLSSAAPHRVNAFHIHPKKPQRELWAVVEGQLLVWLVDCRRDSPTAGLRQAVVLSSEEPSFLMIPAGVAHGYKAGPDGALLLYAMDQQFDASDPNEGRLPWDHFGRELWEEDRG